MLPLDASQLYDLPEAGRLLFMGAGRLRRLVGQRRIPWTIEGGRTVLPRAWVDAEAGISATDGEALRVYWLERLAPADVEATRPSKDLRHLEGVTPLDPEDAAIRLTADLVRLRGLDARGIVPALRIDGETRYDATLVDLLASERYEEADRRRAEVLAWARIEWVASLDEGAVEKPAVTRPAPEEAVAAAPHAWRMPEDIASLPDMDESADEEADPGEGMIEAEGFDTVEED
jgi:hypothetical protein